MEELLLVFYLRPARSKASDVAIAEVLALLHMQHAWVSEEGPLSEQGGLFWIMLPAHRLDEAVARLSRLGYTSAVDVLEPAFEPVQVPRPQHESARTVRWHRHGYRLRRIYEEDMEESREHSPDRRTILLESCDHTICSLTAYRGNGQLLSRCALPVYDARLLVNLVSTSGRGCLLDPFAGVGGIALEALAGGYTVYSTDTDPALCHHLCDLGSQHTVADARALPFADAMFDAIATEPPYHDSATPVVVESLAECTRVLKPGCKMALLSASSQADALRREAANQGLLTILDAPIERQGLDVVVLLWQKR
jgi:SAM-dependent methyltransferase